MDLVLSDGLGRIVGLEVKAAASVKPRDTAGLHRLRHLAGDRFLGGAVLYDGVQAIPLPSADGRPIWALPLGCLWEG